MSAMKSIPCTILRGGTSKGVYLMASDLPSDPKERDQLILKIFGSPDVRQIDGLGGADALTSKVAIIAPPSRPDADVDYTFGQVGITDAGIGYQANCGNISAGVGPFAIDKGLVKKSAGKTVVRIHNTNTGKIITADVPMDGEDVAVKGDCVVEGVPGTGARIMLDYSDTVGSVFKRMLPTGNPVDVLTVPGLGDIEVSIVDVGNPLAFVRAKDIGLTGIEKPEDIDSRPELIEMLENIRGAALVRIGVAPTIQAALEKVPGIPMVAFITEPTEYEKFTDGKTVAAEQIDLSSRLIFVRKMHKTYPGTGAVCTASAVKIKGTIPNQIVKNAEELKLVRIGHPAGVIEVEVDADYSNGIGKITRAAIDRTARKIMDGYVYVTE